MAALSDVFRSQVEKYFWKARPSFDRARLPFGAVTLGQMSMMSLLRSWSKSLVVQSASYFSTKGPSSGRASPTRKRRQAQSHLD